MAQVDTELDVDSKSIAFDSLLVSEVGVSSNCRLLVV